MPIFPLTPQQLSNLKKELKSSKKKTVKILDELIANPSNPQQLNVIQLALFCLDLNGDLNLAQKLSNSFITHGLFSQAFSILLVQHSLLHSKDQKITSPKTPSKTEIVKLLRVDPKIFIRAPNYICIFLINAMRVLLGLELEYDLKDLFCKKDGLIYWLDRLEKVDSMVIQDHAFRISYSLFNNQLKNPKVKLCSGIFCFILDIVDHAKVVLTLYKASSKFQQDNFDKLVANIGRQLLKLDLIVQRKFFKYVISMQMTSKSSTCHVWFELILNLAPETDDAFMKLALQFLGDSEILVFLFRDFKSVTVPWVNFKRKAITCDFEVSLIRALYPKAIKSIVERSDQVFKSKAQDWSFPVNTTELNSYLEGIDLLSFYTKGLQKEGLKYSHSLLLSKCQVLFLLESDLESIIACLDLLENFIDLRMAGLTYNLAACSANRGVNKDALQYFTRCRRYYTACISDQSLLIRKLLKPVQGECQCLLALKKYSDCIELIHFILKKLSAKEWMEKDNLKQFQCFISLSIVANSKLENSKFDYICNLFDGWNSEVFEMEWKYASQQGSEEQQFQLLKEASTKENSPPKKAEILLKMAALDRPNGEAYCQQAKVMIDNLDQTDPSVQSQRAIFFCESAISSGVKNSGELLCGLQIWQDIFGHIILYRPGVKKPTDAGNLDYEYLFHYLNQLADYLMAIANYQMSIFAYGLASRLCTLCPEINQAKESLGIYVSLAFNYMELGYSGRAGLSLGIAKSFLPHVDAEATSAFYSLYSEYLLSIGNVPKSTEIRARVFNGSVDIDCLGKLLDSKLSLLNGDIQASSISVHAGYRNAMQLLKSSSKIETRVIALVLKCLLILVNLLIFQGFPKKIDYYINQGLILSEKLNSPVWHGIFSMEKAKLHCKRGEMDESRTGISGALLDFDGVDELALFSARLHLAHGDILMKEADTEDIAQTEFLSAETIIATGLDPEFFLKFDLGRIQKHLVSFSDNSKDISRCDGLEIVKGTVLCSVSALNFKMGNFKDAEKKLAIAAKLPLNHTEKCLYYFNLSLLRYEQLMKASHAIDKAEIFSDAVLGYPFHTEPLVKRKFCSTALLNNFNKLELFLEEAFLIIAEHGNPADARYLSYLSVSIIMFKSFIMQVYSDNCLSLCHFYQEYPKSIYYGRKKGLPLVQKAGLQAQWKTRMNSSVWDKIPKDIIVCCINCDTLQDTLFITRHENGKKVLFKLPIRRLSQREAEVNGAGLSFADAMKEFDDIMALNKETTSNAKFCIEAEDRKKWKRSREELDDRLEKFLDRIESEWLAGFKGLLSSREIPQSAFESLSKFKVRLEKLLLTYLSRCINKKTPIHVDEELCKIFLQIGSDPEFEALEDVLYYLLDSFQSRGISIEYDEINIEDMRDDLKDAITLFYKESRMKTSKASYKHLLIIPDKSIQHLPWESLSILRGHSVSRMPSLEMLSQYLEMDQTVDRDSLFYVLNPSGDLIRTEKKFKAVLRESNGIIGRVPRKEEFLQGITSAQIFLYFGHGGGENYIDVFNIEKLSSVPILLLFGCSSGRLKPCGDFDSHGISLEYLAAGSLGILGNLWDVTDIDIDKFSDDLITRWGLFNSAKANRSSLPESCAKAREACNLKFIVGAAPVFYGLRPSFR